MSTPSSLTSEAAAELLDFNQHFSSRTVGTDGKESGRLLEEKEELLRNKKPYSSTGVISVCLKRTDDYL